MIRKLVNSSLAVIALLGLAGSVQAADLSAKVNGRTRTWIENKAVKDSTTTTQALAEGRLGADVTAVVDGWTITLFQNLDLDSDEGKTNPTIREQKITVANDSLAFTLGRFYPYGVTKGLAYGVGAVADSASFWIGENVPTATLTDHAALNITKLGLTLLVGLNAYEDATSDGGNRNETMIGAIYGNSFGAIDLGVEVLSASSAIDEKNSGAVKDGKYDGMTFSALAIGLGYHISEITGIALNYESNTRKDGNDGAEEVKVTIAEVWFDLGFNESTGVSLGYGSRATDDGSDNLKTDTLVSVLFKKSLGPLAFHAGYLASTEKDDDIDAGTGEETDASVTTVALGMEFVF